MSCYIDREIAIYLGSVWEKTKSRFAMKTGLEVANSLHQENVKSFNYRYDEKEEANPIKILPEYKDYSLAQINKSIACLAYQSCEHPEWNTSDAREYLEILQSMAIRKEFPEWEEKEWGAPKRA